MEQPVSEAHPFFQIARMTLPPRLEAGDIRFSASQFLSISVLRISGELRDARRGLASHCIYHFSGQGSARYGNC